MGVVLCADIQGAGWNILTRRGDQSELPKHGNLKAAISIFRKESNKKY